MVDIPLTLHGKERTVRIRMWTHNERLDADEKSGLRAAQAASRWRETKLEDPRIALNPAVSERFMAAAAAAADQVLGAQTKWDLMRVSKALEDPKMTEDELGALPQDEWEELRSAVDAHLDRHRERLEMFLARITEKVNDPEVIGAIQNALREAFATDALKKSSGT